MKRRILLGKMLNLRDLGGYPVWGGKRTAWERLLRGDTPVELELEDEDWLLDRGITTVIDLRSQGEVSRRPDCLQGRPGFTYYNIPLVGGEELPNLEEDVPRAYFDMLARQEAPAQVLRAIARAEGGVLYHCTAGKDRTGCISALLLGLAGVDRLDILADYQISALYIRPVVRALRDRFPDMAPYAGNSKPEYLDGCLDLLLERYGSFEGYLEAIGLTGAEVEALRAKLLD